MSRLPTHRLFVFAAFAALAAGGWGSLVADPRIVRLVISAALAVVAAVALAVLPVERLSRARAIGSVALVGIVGLAASLAALGVPARDLVPWEWGELAARIDDGFDGLGGSIEYPFAGENETSRWLLVAAMPVLLIAAAVLAFGRGRREGPDVSALVLLVAAFAIPATVRPASMPLLWGSVLLVLISLWLWQRPNRVVAAIATVVCFGAVAVPIASALDAKDPVLDYRDWTLPAPEAGTTFEWDQSFGPIDWERTNETLFEVRTAEPRYLRAEVLDDFYGYGWRRSVTGGRQVPEDIDPVEGTLGVRGEDRWVTKARVSVGGLESPFVLSPGTELDLSGVEGVQRADDGTLLVEDEPLTEGSDYSITAYAPDPSPKAMRRASSSYDLYLEAYTEIAFPYSEPNLETGLVTVHRGSMPAWGSGVPLDFTLRDEISGSPYQRIADISERLTAGESNAYDAVRAVEDWVRNRADYSENPGEHDVPLNAFLFGERIGYCQHFSGAMALMLRFAGIPTRVAAGFTPGEQMGQPEESGESTYAVTGFDAHSWVEVYFNGIGWVPFDPTPADAPNRSQSEGSAAASSADPGARGGEDERNLAREREPDIAGEGQGLTQEPGAAEGDGGPSSAWILVVLIPLGLLGAVTFVRTIRHRGLSEEEVADRELRELADALGPAGLRDSGLTTLRRLQSHLETLSLPAAAAYAGRLAELRFAPSPGPPPSLAERRAARRDLSSGGGPSRYLRMLVAMPPGGPRV